VAAPFARLDALVYQNPNLILEIKSTVVSDRGPNSAESDLGREAKAISRLRDIGNEIHSKWPTQIPFFCPSPSRNTTKRPKPAICSAASVVLTPLQ